MTTEAVSKVGYAHSKVAMKKKSGYRGRCRRRNHDRYAPDNKTVPMALQRLFLSCKDVFRGPGTVPAPSHVQMLCSILGKCFFSYTSSFLVQFSCFSFGRCTRMTCMLWNLNPSSSFIHAHIYYQSWEILNQPLKKKKRKRKGKIQYYQINTILFHEMIYERWERSTAPYFISCHVCVSINCNNTYSHVKSKEQYSLQHENLLKKGALLYWQ